MRYVRHLVVSLSVGMTIATVLCAAASWAAGNTAGGGTVIGETTLFTWQFVVIVATQVGSTAAFYAGVRAHITNADIHRGYRELAEDFPTHAECRLRHDKDGAGDGEDKAG